MPSAPTAQIARVLHVAFVASSLMVTGFFAWFPPLGDLESRVRLSLLYGAFVVGFGLCLVPVLIAGRLARPSATDAADWWVRNLPSALMVWMLFEAAAIVGAVCRFLTGDQLALVIPVAAILLLVVHSPGRLAGS